MSYEPERNREYLKRRYAAQRAEFYAFLGGVCVVCGTTEQLQIDHIDRSQKSFSVGKLWGKKQLPKVYKELAKCQLLCSACHGRKTGREFSEERTGSFTHGTLYGWQKAKCLCESCYAARRVWYDERNARRRTGSRGPYKQRS